MMTVEEAKAACDRRALSGLPFTFSQLWRMLERENGGPTVEGGKDCYRIADQSIQRLRRAGRISYVRNGRETVWTPTKDAGK